MIFLTAEQKHIKSFVLFILLRRWDIKKNLDNCMVWRAQLLGRGQFDYVKQLVGAGSNTKVIMPFLATMVTSVKLLELSVRHLDSVGPSSCL